MRLQQSLHVKKPVSNIRIRFETLDMPVSANVVVTDVQLQSGELSSGPTFNPAEAGTTKLAAQYRNGVLKTGLDVVGMSNSDKAVPLIMEARNVNGDLRLGSYRFGVVKGRARVDGEALTATHGYGHPPVITERQDLFLKTYVPGRCHLRLAWNERE